MQPWKWNNIAAYSFAIQIGTLSALAVMLFANYKKWQYLSFRGQALGILLAWMVLFSNCSDMHTHIITICGFLLWYWCRARHTLFERMMFYALLIVVVLVPQDVVCPPVVMRFLCYKLTLHLWLPTINLIGMCYLTCAEKLPARSMP
jgi:hypothetical protein